MGFALRDFTGGRQGPAGNPAEFGSRLPRCRASSHGQALVADFQRWTCNSPSSLVDRVDEPGTARLGRHRVKRIDFNKAPGKR